MEPEVRRAYAILDLVPPVGEADLKRQYRDLVRRWHPDRYLRDPVGQADAARTMREINDAYRILLASLTSQETCPPPAMQVGSLLPHENIDRIVASINQSQAWSVVPRMSRSRWLSLGVVFLYFFLGTALLAYVGGPASSGIASAAGKAFGYFWLPLYLIWRADAESTPPEGRAIFEAIGWVLMAGPAVLAIAWWASR